MDTKKAIIIGAGPAGLTAALELLRETDLRPAIYEMSNDLGGISKTCNYNGNRIDIGGHRFFSKSDRVMAWWSDILPTMGAPASDDRRLKRQVPCSQVAGAPDPEQTDRVMLVRSRLSRILFGRKFYDYPIGLNATTFTNLGLPRILKIALSYLRATLFPIRPERNLEDFFINRFGRELYATFFRDYTEKVWGVPCTQIDPSWGAQRIKGLSIYRALLHSVRQLLPRRSSIAQKKTETSLIEEFLYPKFGPGQLWEAVGQQVTQLGGEIHLQRRVVSIAQRDGRITGITVEGPDGDREEIDGEIFFSTMPLRDLCLALSPPPPPEIRAIAEGLVYRDFITVGLLLSGLKPEVSKDGNLPDNWIYVQEPDVKLGRIQIFNNWSPYMVADPRRIWLGLEYFCTEGDDLWNLEDRELAQLAVTELCKLNFIDADAVLDSVVIRMPKAYPAYFGSYDRFPALRDHLDAIPNLYLLGRNGMHRYNNMDHSMLTAFAAVELVKRGSTDKSPPWSINAESDYHEKK
jgi:protoporphyrinogen oxidase